MVFDPSSEQLRIAAEAADRLIGFYSTIQASNPQAYAAGLVQVFSRYPEFLIAAAIDPVDGLPGENDRLPSIAKVKAFLEPRYQDHLRTVERQERFNRKRLPEPPRDLEAEQRIAQGFEKLSFRLRNGTDAA